MAKKPVQNAGAAGMGGASGYGYEAPAPAAPPTITTGGDPMQWAQSDPTYQALLAALQAGEGSTAATNRAQIQQEAIKYGYNIPELGQFLDPGMLQQIQDNPYSLAALAKQGHATNLRNIQNSLAARGAYNSGELTYGIGNEGQRYNEEDLTNRGNLEAQINALLGQQAAQKASDAAQEAQALGQATQTQAALHPVGTATYDASTGSYVDPYGNHFNADGSAYTAKPTTPPAAPKPPAAPTQSPRWAMTESYGGIGAPPMGAPPQSVDSLAPQGARPFISPPPRQPGVTTPHIGVGW